MAKTENQKKLLKILNEIFQLDQSDLDFGIYRIMNSKSKEINEFLENDLISSVANAFSSNNNNSIQSELDEAIQQAQSLGADPETLPKVIALREHLSSTTSSNNLENDVFSHLANFFKRYYKDGDFVSLRRYKKDTYAIPYEGEEVKLHWANSDQYYIKSGEYFRDYSFKVNDKTIHFKLSDAQIESNNNKATSDKERRFVILDDKPCEVIDDELYINFEYKAIGKEKQEKLNEGAITKALESIEDLEFINALNTLAPTEKNKKRTLFEKHLKSYTSRNSFDYFIHKDLGGFLGRELDFYIKNEMLFLDDIMDSPIKYEEVMGKVKIFKEVSQKIIAFLTQLEELQKKLWEKKKFVIETNYCITLDKIDEAYHEQILACSEQLAEWKELFDVDIQSIDELREEKYLVLDTKFFDMKFKYKLLSEFDNLDVDIDGVLINSENFGALNLLQDRYKERIEAIYIDPPFNLGVNADFLYNTDYKDSTWMSLLYDRLNLGKNLLSKTAINYIRCDENGNHLVRFLGNSIFGKENYQYEFNIQRIRKNVTKQGKITLPLANDSLFMYYKSDSGFIKNPYLKLAKIREAYWRRIDDSAGYRNPPERYIFGKKFVPYKLDAHFKYSQTSMDKMILESKIRLKCKNCSYEHYSGDWTICPKCSSIEATPQYKVEATDVKILDTNWMDISGYSSTTGFSTENSEKLLVRTLEVATSANNIVLDYFLGSGTTIAVAHKMNRQWIGVEMGNHFSSIIMPRMKKVLKTESGFFKYFKLESYEDTLNNLEFKRTKEQEDTLALYPQAKDDYLLNYSLEVESQDSLLNIDTFKTPFDYKLKIATSSVGETKDTTIDLVETFNYLLGLVVKRIELLKGYFVVEGQNLKKEKILIIWRDGQSSDELNEFFKKMDWSVYDREFDTIYVNGDNNLDNLKQDEDHFKVKLIEQAFKDLMFGDSSLDYSKKVFKSTAKKKNAFEKMVEKTVKTSQEIEGYLEASQEITEKAKILKDKHAIKVSTRS